MKLDFCAVCGTTEDLQQHHIEPVILTGISRKDDTSDKEITLCAYHHSIVHGVAKFHRYNHKFLTKEGLKKVRKEGVTLGRPSKTTSTQKKEIINKLRDNQSVSSLAREYNVSRATILMIKNNSGVPMPTKVGKVNVFNFIDCE